MFDIGWGELVVIGIVALIVFGPKELPGVLRMLGQWMSKVRRMAADFQGQFQEAMREAEMAELKKQVDQIADTTKDFTHYDPFETARKEIESAVEDKPKTESSAAAPAEPASSEVETSSPASAPVPAPSQPAVETVAQSERDFLGFGEELDASKPAGPGGGRPA
jgi:sec-independent protein translocase protein TatB